MITLTQTDWTTLKIVSDGDKLRAIPMDRKQLEAFLSRYEWVSGGRRRGATVGVYKRVTNK